MLIDTHCHLYYEDLKNDIYNVINRASDLGVNKFICVSTNLNDAEECIELAKNFEPIWATAGIHPHDAKSAPIKFENKLKSLLNNKKIVISGAFLNVSREDLKKIIEQNGGKNSSSVSKSTDLLIAGENMGPSKLEKAKNFKIKIINEDDFLKLIDQESNNSEAKQYEQGELF